MKKRFAWMGLLVFLLAAAIHGAAWAAEERRAVSPVAMEISLLYGQRGKLGSYIPVSVRLYGQSAAQFEGKRIPFISRWGRRAAICMWFSNRRPGRP